MKKKIIIAGGNGSIGKILVKSLANTHSVIVLDKKIERKFNNFYKVDLTNFYKTQEVIKKIYKKFKSIDVLINCMGDINNFSIISLNENNLKKNYLNFKKVLSDHLFSNYLITMLIVNYNFQIRKKCTIINFSSISEQGNIGQAAYSSAKGAINSLTKVMSKELGVLGYRTNALAPGFFDTKSTLKSLSNSKIKKLKNSIPLRKLGNKNDLIKTIKFIIQNNYLNGSIIKIDGGVSI